MKSRRGTPQLTLPFATAHEASPRERATAFAHDDSPFEPTELDLRPFDELGPGSLAQTALNRLGLHRNGLARPANDTPAPKRQPSRIVSVPYERAEQMASELRVLVGAPVKLHVHDNRSTMVSFRRDTKTLHMRVHHMFLGAGPEVVHALADYAKARSLRAGRVLDQYVRQNRGHIKPVDLEEARQRPMRTTGEVYDLAEIYGRLNERYFDGTVDARIGWGRGSTGRRRHSIRMGAYYHDTATILIHPALDRPEVPRYFVELVVYHEMLHQAVPQQRGDDGRRCIHSEEFREREREFIDFDRARNWERRNLSVLLRPKRVR